MLGENAVAYLDLTGSGAETIAHLRENGRICVMFCAFDGNPQAQGQRAMEVGFATWLGMMIGTAAMNEPLTASKATLLFRSDFRRIPS